MSRPDYLSPILLQDAVHFQNNVDTGQPRTIRMLNPNRCAMLVDELRFYSSDRPGFEPFIDLDDVFVNFKMGSIPLTDDFVPLYGLALNYNIQPTNQIYVPDWFGNSTVEVGYTYRLPKPMYVPPDVPLEIILRKVRHGLTIDTPAFDVMVVAVCRSMPESHPQPDYIYVPWTSSFEVDPNYTVAAPLLGFSEEPMTVTSPTNRLGNPHGEDLCVTKLTGPYPTLRQPDANGAIFYPDRAVTIQATLSNGKIVIRDKVPYFDVFPLQKPWIDMHAYLPPKTFVRVHLEADPNFWEVGAANPVYATATPLSNETRLRPIRICIQGYRKLEKPWGARP